MFASVAAMAQIESGKVYRIVNLNYGTAASEKFVDNTVSCNSIGSKSDYNQLWIITETATEGKYTIQNVFTGRNLHFNQYTNQKFYTENDAEYGLYINDNSALFPGGYTITQAKNNSLTMHCDGSSNCVPWTKDEKPSNWYFEKVELSDEDLAAARAEYDALNFVLSNKAAIIANSKKYFTDNTGCAISDTYAAMSDEDLTAAMTADNLPAELQAVILKVKNGTWNTVKREQEFRIYDYKPYSDPYYWADLLYTRYFCYVNNPTGISTNNAKSCLYVFVEKVPENTTLKICEMVGTSFWGTDTELHEGLNIVLSSNKDGHLYIRYNCVTDTAGAKLADYPAVKIHIEGGYVNGFWSKERGHTNADWKYMQDNMFENESAIQAVGDHTVLCFRKKEFIQPYQYTDAWGYRVEGCPEKITEVMALWDFWNAAQRKYMNLEKYYPWFNNKQLAMSDDGGFMDASNWRTHYNNNTLTTIVNYDRITRDGGSAWGPNHEIGHTNQYAFEIVGTSEVSNNALSNFTIFDVGTHTSRGNNLENQILDFENKVPYVGRGEKMYGQKLFSMTRMYFQLFLYFHAAKKNETFYQQVFERLRYDRLIGWSTRAQDILDSNGYYIGSMDAKYDQLKFAEICCEVAQMDLSEFFEAWGFFIPMKNLYVGDYGHHYVYLHQEDIDASKARMQKYEKKGGHIMFIEDRVRKSKRLDGNGYRADYSDEVRVGTVGDFGQWEDYIDESVKAQGYYYTNTGSKINILEVSGAGGALGFKLYNADTDELLTYTNRKTMTIPMSARKANLKVVAAQADGTDYVVPNATEGPEDFQYNTLASSITKCMTVTSAVMKADNEIGKYYPEKVARLDSIYKLAYDAYKNKDTSVHSYGDWSAMLEDEYTNILSDLNVRPIIKENCKYYFKNNTSSTYYLQNGSAGLSAITSQNPATDASLLWEFVSTGEPSEYYMMSSSGTYLSDLTIDQQVYASTVTKSNAIKVKISYTDNGRVLITRSDNDALGIAYKSKKVVGGSTANDNSARWHAYIAEDNSVEFEKEEITNLMNRAKCILAEVTDTLELEKGNSEYMSENIYSQTSNLRDLIVELYNVYDNIQSQMSNPAAYYANIQTLRGVLNNFDGAYIVKSPIAINDGKIYWYAIKSAKTGKHWAATNASNALLSLNSLVGENGPSDMELWCFMSDGRGGYKLYNAAKDLFVYRQKATITNKNPQYFITSTSDVAALSFELAFDVDKKKLTIATLDKYVYENSSNERPSLNTTASAWELELVAIEENSELFESVTAIDEVVVEGEFVNGETYDMFGRKVTNPVKNNVYIKDNQKIIY